MMCQYLLTHGMKQASVTPMQLGRNFTCLATGFKGSITPLPYISPPIPYTNGKQRENILTYRIK